MTAFQLEDSRGFEAAISEAQEAPVLLERSGRPVAVLLSVEEYSALAEERLDNEAYDRHFGSFERGEAHFLSNADWQAIREGTYEYPDLPSDDLAIPHDCVRA
ncbi:MAG: type II toxin-antitoxin system prevent-host-death family antitoxin [Acidobacteriota bacterium]